MYLGVYYFTNDHAHQDSQFLRSTISSFFVQLAPLDLTATNHARDS